MILKLYYDTDIATLTYKGATFYNGQEMNFDQNVVSKDFTYTLKNGNLNIGGTFAVEFFTTNTYMQGFNFTDATNKFSFSQNTVVESFTKNQSYDTSIKCEPFVVIMSSNYTVSGQINQVRSVVAGGDFKTKTVTKSGDNDIITVDYGDSFELTSAKFYYRDPVTYGHYENASTSISADKHKFSITVPRDKITSNGGTGDVFAYFVLPEVKKVVSTNINVKYNDGVTTQTISYPDQAAGTISGAIKAANGYTIKSVARAWYLNHSTGLQVNLDNFIATKVSNYKYNFSFSVNDSNLTHFNTNPTDYITIALTTEKEKGNLSIDDSGLVHCSINPSTIVQDTETKLTLSADLGYILNGLGNYTVDGQTTSFTCSNVQSYSFIVTANASLSISFTATKVEAPANASISHTYVLDQDGYNLLGKQFIQAVNTSGDGFTQYDYSKFVNYLYQIPFTVPEDITKPSTSISIGKTSLDVSCSYVTHETLTIDLGQIELPTATSIDYNVLDISLFVPFTDKIELPKTVLGSKIKLSMQVNLLNESAVLIVSQNDTVIFTCGSQVFTDLPLYFTAGTKDILVKTFKTRYQNTINQAYIKINFNKPVTNLTSYRTNEHGTLSDYKGFTSVSHGTLKNSISQEIDGLIINKLKQGVIIK